MTTLANLATELIELVCEFAAEYAREDWEFRLGSNGDANVRASFVSRHLVGLPLIHPRWTVPGQKALYRYVCLMNAVRYKAFQESLTQYPHNGRYVRALLIDWGIQDYGGPDGYSYKVLGWFHEMEIQQVVRLCPFLEQFYPGRNSPVISQEGIAALGSVDSIRSITWRRADFQKYGDAVNRAQSSWPHLDTVEIFESLTEDDFKYVRNISTRLRSLKVHNTQLEYELQKNRELWSFCNLREFHLSMSSLPIGWTTPPILRFCGSNITTLSLPSNTLDYYRDIFGEFLNQLTPRLENLRLFVSFVLTLDWGERFQSPSRYYQTPRNYPWHSKSLRSVSIGLHDVETMPLYVQYAVNAFIRPDAFPNVRKVLISWRDANGELQIRNVMNHE